MNNIREIYDSFANNEDLFNFSLEELQTLFKVDPKEFNSIKYRTKVLPALLEIFMYSWIFEAYDIDALREDFNLPSIERFEKVLEISQYCDTFMYYLSEEKCNHPIVNEWENLVNAYEYYNAFFGSIISFSDDIGDSNEKLALDGCVNIFKKDIDSFSTKNLLNLFKITDALNDKELMITFSEIAYSVVKKSVLLLGSNKLINIQPFKISNANTEDIIYTYDSAKPFLLTKIIEIINNISVKRGDEIIELNLDNLEVNFYDGESNELSEDDKLALAQDEGYDSIEELNESIKDEIESENLEYTIGEAVEEIDMWFTYFKSFQFKSIKSIYEKNKMLELCKKM